MGDLELAGMEARVPLTWAEETLIALFRRVLFTRTFCFLAAIMRLVPHLRGVLNERLEFFLCVCVQVELGRLIQLAGFGLSVIHRPHPSFSANLGIIPKFSRQSLCDSKCEIPQSPRQDGDGCGLASQANRTRHLVRQVALAGAPDAKRGCLPLPVAGEWLSGGSRFAGAWITDPGPVGSIPTTSTLPAQAP